MSFFYDADPQSIVDALAADDFDTLSMLLSDQQGGLEDFLATQTFVNLTATLDGAGNATIAHNIDTTGATVTVCQAFYNGGSGRHKPLAVTYVDATSVVVTGGTAGAACHATLVVAVGFVTF